MTRWALIVDQTVREIITLSPAGRYHPSLVWVPCGPDVREGWVQQADGTLVAPPSPPASPPTVDQVLAQELAAATTVATLLAALRRRWPVT